MNEVNTSWLMYYEYNPETGDITWHKEPAPVPVRSFYTEDDFIFYNEMVIDETGAKIELLRQAITTLGKKYC